MKNYKLGNFICELREDAGMDQKTLAALLGVSASAISQCENGGGIKTEKLYQLSELFGVSLDELLSCKRAGQSITEKLDDLYYIDEKELQQAVDVCDYEVIAELFQRIKIVRERFEDLIYKRIFAKLTTDEDLEFQYLMKYYNRNINASKYFTTFIVFFEDNQIYDNIKETLLNAIEANKRNSITWELNKIFSLKFDLHLQEIMAILGNDDRIETEQSRLECFWTVFSALPSLSKDLLFSHIVYDDSGFNMKLLNIKAMMEQGVKLLYSPMIKNMDYIDKEIIEALEGNIEYDQKLSNVARIYQHNCINEFAYTDYIRLTYDDYQSCIDTAGMEDLTSLVDLWVKDKIAYWNRFKNARFYRKISKEV